MRMNASEALRAFELFLRAERNLSPHTRRAYLSDLRQFAAHQGEGFVPERTTGAEVRDFLASLHGRRGPATLGRKLASLRAFFGFLMREGGCALDPTAGMSAPRLPRRLPRPLPVDECMGLVDGVAPGPAAIELRDRALLELLYGAGLRVAELSSLDVRDLDLHRGDVRVIGKGGKQRVVPLPASARESLAAWVGSRRAPGILAQPLFISLRRGRASRASEARSERKASTGKRSAQRGEAERRRRRRLCRRRTANRRRRLCRRRTRKARPARRAAHRRAPRAPRPDRQPRPPAPAAPQLCDPPARHGRRPARDPGAARAREPVDDREVHRRLRGAAGRCLRSRAPPRAGAAQGARARRDEDESAHRARPPCSPWSAAAGSRWPRTDR